MSTKGENSVEQPALYPTIFVIFGITGDLANRKLLPALLSLYSKKLLPKRFSVVGFSRRSFSREEFRDFIRSKINIRQGQFREEDVKHFIDHVTYVQGFFDQQESYKTLATKQTGIGATVVTPEDSPILNFLFFIVYCDSNGS